MENIWRYCNEDISFGGVVFADSEEEAMAKVASYLSDNGYDEDDIAGLIVWKCTEDDDFGKDHPDVLPVYY